MPQGLKIPRDQVDLHVDAIAGPEAAQLGARQGFQDERDLETARRHRRDREGDPVERDRPLRRHEPAQPLVARVPAAHRGRTRRQHD